VQRLRGRGRPDKDSAVLIRTSATISPAPARRKPPRPRPGWVAAYEQLVSVSLHAPPGVHSRSCRPVPVLPGVRVPCDRAGSAGFSSWSWRLRVRFPPRFGPRARARSRLGRPSMPRLVRRISQARCCGLYRPLALRHHVRTCGGETVRKRRAMNDVGAAPDQAGSMIGEPSRPRRDPEQVSRSM